MLHLSGSSGVETEPRPVERPGELTAWSCCVSATVGGSDGPRHSTPASLRRKPRARFDKRQQLSRSHELSGHIKTERSVDDPHAGSRGGRPGQHHVPERPRDQAHTPAHSKHRPLHSLHQPEGEKLERAFHPDMNHGNAVCPQPQLPSPWN